MQRPYRLAYLVSHPIQYQAPLLRRIAADPEIDLKVFFCSDFSTRQHLDDGFGQVIEWDTPLLDGYEYEFLPACADPGPPTVFRPINRGLPAKLREGNFDALWVHGYMRWYHIVAMTFARLQGRIVLNRDEAWAKSAERSPGKDVFKKFLYFMLRRICHGWLTIGSVHREYYLENGMSADTIFAVPYAVDNEVFAERARMAEATREELRDSLGLEPDRPVVLYASKFIRRKFPDHLVAAFARISKNPATRNPYLVMVGDGEMRAELEEQVKNLGIANDVRFPGFQNQSNLPRFYDLCDVFVLPSKLEPWGLVVNELMCAGRAVIASDEVGSAHDLIKNGENGFIFPAGNEEALTSALNTVLSDADLCKKMGERSREIIAKWGFDEDIAGLKAALRHFIKDGSGDGPSRN